MYIVQPFQVRVAVSFAAAAFVVTNMAAAASAICPVAGTSNSQN
jgi:hypothetical protein